MHNMKARSGLEFDIFSSDGSKNISDELSARLVSASVAEASRYWSDVLTLPIQKFPLEEYIENLKEGITEGIFAIGGIELKDHVNLSVLLHILKPDLYVESGVFRGASLHAALFSVDADRVIGIDPVDRFLLDSIRKRLVNPIEVNCDFEDLNANAGSDARKAVYFDDHINSMLRLVQARQNGFRYAIFDDSCGIEGIGQRRYPALPTVGMLRHQDLFKLGDTLEWAVPVRTKIEYLKGLLQTGQLVKYRRLRVVIDEGILEELSQGAECVETIIPFPDLSELLFSQQPGRINNTQKYLVILKEG